MPTYRSVRGRALVRGAVGSAAYSGALVGRKRKRIAYPTSRFGRTFRYGGVSRGKSLYASGISGSTRRTFPAIGREVPLYVAPRKAMEEMHFNTIPQATYGMHTTGFVVQLNTITRGNAINERVGNRVILKSLHVRGDVYCGINVTVASGAMMIVYDRQPQGTLPAYTDIMEAGGVNAFQNASYRDRFRILLRRDWCLEQNPVDSAVRTGDSIRRVDEILYLNLPTVYQDGSSGGLISDIRTGGLYAVFCGSQPSGTATLIGALAFRYTFSP